MPSCSEILQLYERIKNQYPGVELFGSALLCLEDPSVSPEDLDVFYDGRRDQYITVDGINIHMVAKSSIVYTIYRLCRTVKRTPREIYACMDMAKGKGVRYLLEHLLKS